MTQPIKEPFVLSGKAREVFKWLEIKTKRALEAERALREDKRLCVLDHQTVCGVPGSVPCMDVYCPVWEKVKGELKNRVEEGDQHIADNMKDYWKHLGNED